MNPTYLCFVFLFWLLGFFLFWRVPRPNRKADVHARPLTLSLIIPARNEEKNLVRLLKSIAQEKRGPEEIILVDDHSEDTTAEVGLKAGCGVIRSQELPEGWVGKTWACWQGAGQAKGDLFLFLDADTFLEAGGLPPLISTYRGRGGLFSVYPYHRMERPYEQLSAFFNLIAMAGTGSFTMLGERLRPKGAFGPCILCSRQDYFAVGGHAHEKVRGEILETLALGGAFHKAGMPVHVYGGKGALSYRMYPEGIGSLMQGFGKSFGVGMQGTPWFLFVLIVLWVAGGFSITRHLLQHGLQGDLGAFSAWAVMDLLYVLQVFWMLVRIGTFRFYTALFFQIPLFFFLAVFLLSLFQTFGLGRVSWKGRAVKTPWVRR